MRVWIKATGLERTADRADAPVHHVAGRDDVDAGFGLHQRLAGQHLHRAVVEDVAVFVEQAVLAVAGVRIERDVGEQPQAREALFQLAQCPRDQPCGVRRLVAAGVLQRRLDDREQGHHRDAQFDALLGHVVQPVQAAALHAGHARHVLRLRVAVEHEHRQDQVLRRQAMLAHQRSGERIAAQAARSAGRKRGGRVHVGHPGGPLQDRPSVGRCAARRGAPNLGKLLFHKRDGVC